MAVHFEVKCQSAVIFLADYAPELVLNILMDSFFIMKIET